MAGADKRVFTQESLDFLEGLERKNERTWFEARREVYEESIKGPMLDLIDSVSEGLADCAPEHLAPAHKLMLRIYRDTRFSSDKRPYKNHIAAWWGHSAFRRTSGAGFYFRLAPKEYVIAAGIFMPDPQQLRALRTSLLTIYPEVAKQLTRLKRGGLNEMQEPGALLPLPRGFHRSHPAASLVRQRKWGAQRTSSTADALEPGFAQALANDFRKTSELVRLLNQPLLESGKTKQPAL